MFDPELEAEWAEALGKADVVGCEPEGTWCALYAIVHGGTAELLAEHPGSDREALRALPLRKAVVYRDAGFLWSIGDEGCDVWKPGWAAPFKIEGDSLVFSGQQAPRADLVEVHSFVDDKTRDWHGVEIVLADRSAHPIVTTVAPIDRAWSVELARAIAAHCGVPYRHVVPPECRVAIDAARRVSDAQTQQLVEGLLDAYDHWDDPDRVAAREARAAAKAQRDGASLTRFYVMTEQSRIVAIDRDDATQAAVVSVDRSTNQPLMRVISRGPRSETKTTDLVGATYRQSLVYWVIDENTCMVFRRRGELCALCRVGEELEVGTRSIPIADLRAVIAFAVPERDGHRGLALELASGECVLVEEDDDARYDRAAPSAWNVVLARELAPALGVGLREVTSDVIERPPAPTNPAHAVIAACGTPVFAKTLGPAERERAVREGRVLHVWSVGTRGMGDSDFRASFWICSDAAGDHDLVFERPIPTSIEGRWPAWETEEDVYAAFGLSADS